MDALPLVRYWTLHGPDGQVATCELVRTAQGLEVRCAWTGDRAQADAARAASIQAVADALNLAEAWKANYIARGWAAREGQSPAT
jgi:hypothetical protein